MNSHVAFELFDPLAIGIVIGLLVAGPIFVSPKLALAVLVQIGIALGTTVATGSFDAVSLVIQKVIGQVSENPKLAAGLLGGVVAAGIFGTILRHSRGERRHEDA